MKNKKEESIESELKKMKYPFLNPAWISSPRVPTKYPPTKTNQAGVLSMNSILKKFTRGEKISVGTALNYYFDDEGLPKNADKKTIEKRYKNMELPTLEKKGADIIDAEKVDLYLAEKRAKAIEKIKSASAEAQTAPEGAGDPSPAEKPVEGKKEAEKASK